MEDKYICIKCKIEKPLTKEFFYLTKKGFLYTCIECYKEINKINKQKSKEIIDRYNQEYYLKNKVKENKRCKDYKIKKGIITGKGQTIPEKQITQLLKSKNILFKSEFSFEDCRNKQGEILTFDFFLPNLNICIEYDGIYHFKPIFGEEKLKKSQENDFVKNCFCQEKGIKLIRLREIVNKDLIKILQNE